MLIIQQLFRFGLVGGLAAVTHLILVMLLTHYTSIALPVANIWAFLGAFWVSFVGHYFFSFNQTQAKPPIVQALWRFFGVAVLGFLVNEALVVVLLATTRLSQFWIVSIAIILSAAVNFVCSRYFAFRAPQ